MMPRTPATPQRKRPKSRFRGWNDDLSVDRPAAFNASPSHTRSHFHVDDNATLQRDVEKLRAWSVSPRQRATLGKRSDERENWDEDFLDTTESPAKPSSSTPLSNSRGMQRDHSYEDPEQENWDEDFELGMNSGSPRAGPNSSHSRKSRRGRQRGPKWETSDDEMDFDREMGFDRNDEEDKTVTSRSRRKPLSSLSNEADSPPALPALPALPAFLPAIQSSDASSPYASPSSPFPRSSPSHSVFSISATTNSAGQRDRDSTYGSTAHLALSLRRTASAESSPSSPFQLKLINPNRFPQGADLPRERRRLRKKSRPPHLDSSIMELDDRAIAEPTFHHPSTPDLRPCTPPSLSPGVGLVPDAPSSSAQTGMSPPVPASPTSASKSPLLARIGSIRRWGRKRANTTTGGEPVSGGNTQQVMRMPSDTVPPSSFTSKTFDVEADRYDNNRTPRPRSHIVTSDELPLSTLPTLQPQEGRGPPKTPSRKRFFRGSSSGVEANATAGARASSAVEGQDLNIEKSSERERLRLAIFQASSMGPQSSQSGDSETGVTTSPRKHRVRALGHRLLPAKRSVSRGSPERGKDTSDGGSSQLSGIGNKDASMPLTGETPTRLRPRVPSSRHSSRGKAPHVVPRSVSGSAVKERESSPLAPTMSAGGRSVSASGSTGAAPSSEDLAHSDKGSDEKAGQRGFMGSLRRISLVTAHAQRQQQLADTHTLSRAESSTIPPLPCASDETQSSNKLPTSPKVSQQMPSLIKSSTFESIHVDLSSPASGSPRDQSTSGHSRRSGDDIPALTHSKSSSFATSSSQSHGAIGSRLSSASQVASLGRASPLPTGSGSSANSNANSNVNALRRSSLGDLKIPSRISKAQDGLKRDLGRVREFATRVEQMQELRTSYFGIAAQIQNILDSARPPSRATSPTAGLFGLSRSNSRSRANTNPPAPVIDYKGLALGFQAIDTKYSIAWECADLLIELGTGNVSDPSSKRGPASASETTNCERTVSLLGDERKPNVSGTELSSPSSFPSSSPPPLVPRRSTADRQDLRHRQLCLLKEMLNNAESSNDGSQLDIPDILQWAETDKALESTLTLPTDESVVTNPPPGSPLKKRKTSRLVGIRDMLRSLKRSATRAVQIHSEAVVQSSTTLSTESSFDTSVVQADNHPYGYNTVAGTPSHPVYGRRKSDTNAALVKSTRSPDQEYEHFTGKLLLSHKSSPRRPSLASLFRLSQKKGGIESSFESPNRSVDRPEEFPNRLAQGDLQDRHHLDTSQDDIDDSDWDRMDSMSDVDVQLAAIANEPSERGSTMKLRKKKQSNRLSTPPIGLINLKYHITSYNSSQGSFALPDQSAVNVRSPRLSNVDENDVCMSSTGSVPLSGRQTPESSRRPRSRAGKDRHYGKQFSSVRTASPKSNRGLPAFDAPQPSTEGVASLKLAMTPENIKPLLENARVVTARLHDCIADVKGLLIRAESATSTLSASAEHRLPALHFLE